MANKEISELTAGGTLDGTESFHGAQSGNSRKFTSLQLLTPSISASDQSSVRGAISASLKGHIHGLTLSNNGADATNDIDIAAGEAASTETNPVLMVLASALTKRLDAAWAVGTGNGGLDTGSIADGTYHVWLIRRSDTGVVDVLFSASSSSPTMPTNYDQKRRIGSFARVSGVNNAPRAYGAGETTGWVEYTPTFTAFGTVSGIYARSRRVGNMLEISCKFTAGVATATEARMSLGFGGTEGGLTVDSTLVPTIQTSGSFVVGSASDTQRVVLTEGGVGYVTFSRQDISFAGLTKLNGNQFLSEGTGSFICAVPITGW